MFTALAVSSLKLRGVLSGALDSLDTMNPLVGTFGVGTTLGANCGIPGQVSKSCGSMQLYAYMIALTVLCSSYYSTVRTIRTI